METIVFFKKIIILKKYLIFNTVNIDLFLMIIYLKMSLNYIDIKRHHFCI